MASEKLLAEWFWTDRWMGSSAFLLPLEPRGLYREMLTQAWLRGAQLPNDYAAIRRATGASQDEWDRCWPMIQRYWEVRDGHLINTTQLEVYEEAQGVRQRALDRGRNGGKASGRSRRSSNSSSTQVGLKLKPLSLSLTALPWPPPVVPSGGGSPRARGAGLCRRRRSPGGRPPR